MKQEKEKPHTYKQGLAQEHSILISLILNKRQAFTTWSNERTDERKRCFEQIKTRQTSVKPHSIIMISKIFLSKRLQNSLLK